MAKKKRVLAAELAYAAEEFCKKHKLDTSEPTHLNSISKALDQSPAFILRCLRIQRNLPSSITARWRLAKTYPVTVLAMDWLCSQKFKTEAEQHAAFSALQWCAECDE